MAADDKPDAGDPPFAANAVRLSPRLWCVTAIIVLVVMTALPSMWARVESLPKSSDNRVPFRLSNDYWIYSRYAQDAVESHATLLLGDSVVWGHYVSPNSTLSAQLNRIRNRQEFFNLGVDGIHPAALAGLLECYGDAITGQRVVLHCNLLWMSSPQHDLTSEKEFAFNHSSLVPQFYPAIPCYREPLSGRLSVLVNRNSRLMSWARHLQIAYLDGDDWATWSLDHPYTNPLGQLTLALPRPDEPPNPAPSQEPWTAQGIRPVNFRWVDFSKSYQWQAFQRVVSVLQKRGNAVFVMVGPFNEHMLQPQSLDAYRARKEIVARWLNEQRIPHLVVDVLPSETYADASHPLDEGYREWAKQLLADRAFLDFAR